jgi:hypothetical protein
MMIDRKSFGGSVEELEEKDSLVAVHLTFEFSRQLIRFSRGFDIVCRGPPKYMNSRSLPVGKVASPWSFYSVCPSMYLTIRISLE